MKQIVTEKEANLPLDGLEVMNDELMFVLGGAAGGSGSGCGCGCQCSGGKGCGSGCGCDSGSGCGCGCECGCIAPGNSSPSGNKGTGNSSAF